MDRQHGEIELDLHEIFHVLKKRILIILLVAMIFAVGSGVYSFFVATPVYDATAKLYIVTKSTSITSLADIQAGSSLTLDYMELIKSRPVLERVIKGAGLDMSHNELLGKLTVTNPADTRILTINIQNESAYEATRIANEFSVVAQEYISEVMKTDEPTIAEKAYLSTAPVAPQKTRNIVVAFLLGMFLSMLIVIITHIMDDTLKDEDDVERYLMLNTLAVIPLKKGTKKQKRRRLWRRNA